MIKGFLMLDRLLPIAAATMMAAPAFAQVTIAAEGPVVELTISESVEARPEMAAIGAGVTTDADTATAAMRDNARSTSAILERIKAQGIEQGDVQTIGINLSPRYDYDEQSRRQIFRGYQASNRVQVTLRSVERVGELLDELVAAGATDLSGPSWSIADPTTAQAQARERAMVTGQERALEYARLEGYADVRLLQISEDAPFDRPMPFAKADVAEASTPVEPGRVETGVTITVTYELIR